MSKPAKITLAVVVIAVIAATVYGWTIIRQGFSARAQPSKVEELIARTMRKLATTAEIKKMPNPQQATAANIRDGLEHFADHCAVCHANNGNGDTVYGRGMYPKPPDMRAPATQKLSDGEIYSIIQNGIRLTGMPAFGEPGRTDDKSTWNLVLFVRHLPKLTPEQEADMKRLNPAPPTSADDDFLSGEGAETDHHAPQRGNQSPNGEKK